MHSPEIPKLNGHHVDSTSQRIQIVDDEKKFTPELSAQIERWGLRDAGFDYNIVAVFGSQSTGKSTLLNRLFGTNFDVMDESKRQQTTKGIWMCRGKSMSAMVMDVEGTDGRERGEDQDFERKAALFSLASSEVLIINQWEHQVGLYQGANLGLLKTVFEVNLGLFGKRGQDGTTSRTLLLFVIRDHIQTPLENLRATITTDLARIWESLSKPDELKDKRLSDYFDLSFTSLPHKLLKPEEFESQVQSLRRRFVDKEDANYVFKPAYHKRIPADGVAFYMEGIWEQVQSNKDLDLPTQQELLAQFRCDEISAVAMAEFNEQVKSQKRPIEAGKVVEGLGQLMRNWRTDALSRYDRDASRYHPGVYKRKRADLIASLDATLSPLFLGQLKNLHKACLTTFKKEVADGLKGENYSFATVVSSTRHKCESDFTQHAQEALVEGADWVWEDEFELLKDEMRIVADQCRKDETTKMVNQIERNLKKQLSEPVVLALSKARPDMWDTVMKNFKLSLEKAEAVLLTKAKSFDSTEEENQKSTATLRQRAWQALRAKIDEQTTEPVILSKLRGHFEELFRYDEQGIPRVWRPDDDIDGAFKRAKEATLELIPRYARISPRQPSNTFTLPSEPADPMGNGSAEDFDFDASLVVLSESKVLDLETKFRRDADAYYVEAKRSTVSSIAQIPMWMYGVLVVLGWNEAMAVLFNPLYFAFLLIALASAYAIVQLGLVGPLFQVSKTVGSEVQRQAAKKIREHFTEPVAAQVQIEMQSVKKEEDKTDTDLLK